MAWKVVVGANQQGWRQGNWLTEADPAGGDWVEAWDEIFPRYKAQRYATETEAHHVAGRLRSRGFSAATEEVPDENP
jgi:hypothetical protein